MEDRTIGLLAWIVYVGACGAAFAEEAKPAAENDRVAQERQLQAARAADRPVEHVNSQRMKLRFIPAGEFTMGTTAAQVDIIRKDNTTPRATDRVGAEMPPHRLTIKRPFYLGATETTVGQFRAFVKATDYKTDAERDGKGGNIYSLTEKKAVQQAGISWRNAGQEQTDNAPVTQVSWDDIQAFLAWLSGKEKKVYRLPTEAEWEYACRADSHALYYFGDSKSAIGEHAWYNPNSLNRRHAVGQKRPNPWGLYDVYGNVWERCGDWYYATYYAASETVDPQGPKTGSARVIRGGGWHANETRARCGYRASTLPTHRDFDIGFRIVLNID